MTSPDRLTRRDFLKFSGALALSSAIPIRERERLRTWVPYFTHGDLDSDKIALTFDDGWFVEKVERTVDTLQSIGITASFFPVGSNINLFPDTWTQAIDSGFELHNHTMHHVNLDDPQTDISAELRDWESAYAGLGKGDYSNKVVRLPQNNGANNPKLYSVAAKLGYEGVAGWTVGSPGYKSRATKEDVLDVVLPKVMGGSIVLMHFVNPDIEAIPEIYEEAQRKNLTFVVLTKLPGVPIYTP